MASGGLSIPKMGATGLGYNIAAQFGLKLQPTRARPVPLTLQPEDKQRFAPLSGIAVTSRIGTAQQDFKENLLFTHRGLSGPAILRYPPTGRQAQPYESIFCLKIDLFEFLKAKRTQACTLKLLAVLTDFLPKRLLQTLLDPAWLEIRLADCPDQRLKLIAGQLHCWTVKPGGSEGYRTAEVTLGGVDCSEVSSKTLECHQVSGLFFIGEVLDVTGWLGGGNFQWAWSSGWCAGQYT